MRDDLITCIDSCTIRPLKMEDLLDVQAVCQGCFSDPWSLQGWQSTFEHDCNITFVAFQQHQIIGLITATAVVDQAHLHLLAVVSPFRRHGIATLLLQHFLRAMIDQSILVIYLEVRISNHAAQQFYIKHGFVKVGQRKQLYTHPTEDALILKGDISAISSKVMFYRDGVSVKEGLFM